MNKQTRILHAAHLCALIAVLLAAGTVQGYHGQDEDEQKVREAIEKGVIDSHPFPLRDPWKDWVNSGEFLSFRSNAIVRWAEVADATDMTPEQRAEAEALHRRYGKVLHTFKEATKPASLELEERIKKAKEEGDEDLAKTLTRLGHIQTHQKLAVEGGASIELLRLLSDEQLAEWHDYRVAKHARNAMRAHLYHHSVHDEDLQDALNLSGDQRRRIEEKIADVVRDAYMPTVENIEDISALAIFHENKRRAQKMADERVYPWMMRAVLDDTQQAQLAYPDQRWHASVSPAGGVFEPGRTVNAEIGLETEGEAHGARIRYTLDGSRPTADAPLYEEPITITEDTTLRAACFLDDDLLPGRAAVSRFAFVDGLDDTEPGLTYRYYSGLWKRLPRFIDLEPSDEGVAKAIILGVTEKGGDFGLVFSGYLNVAEAGEYVFYLASDDGSALYLDGERIVNNDGIHASREKNAEVRLEPGLHLIRVEYFDAGGGRDLIVQWQGPGFDKRALAGDVLRH